MLVFSAVQRTRPKGSDASEFDSFLPSKGRSAAEQKPAEVDLVRRMPSIQQRKSRSAAGWPLEKRHRAAFYTAATV